LINAVSVGSGEFLAAVTCFVLQDYEGYIRNN